MAYSVYNKLFECIVFKQYLHDLMEFTRGVHVYRVCDTELGFK